MEEIEQPHKNKCQYCGNEYKNVSVHERFCKQNPALSKVQKIQHEEKEQEHEQKPIIISEVQQVEVNPETDDLPWFEDTNGNRKSEMYNFIGIHENIPCVLVMTIYGRIVPPYLVPGFIGMFPKDHVFLEHKSEPQPNEELPINASREPIISPLQADNITQAITSEPTHAQEEKKQSLLGRILGKKEKATTETTNSSADLAKRIIEASNDAKPT